jgi:eukaryotic-like serine/threonine-protein kinase
MNEADDHEEALFEAALRLPTEQRAEYLGQVCGGEANLRRRVEALLAAFERAGGFLKEPAVPHSTPSLTQVEKPGDRIGRYKLREKIGEGGCGVVYVAEQEEPVRRKVALKVIKVGMDTKNVIARFEAERQALAMMDHSNIAKVLDAGATETGRPYFVMELVRGIKITDYCDQNQLSTRERLELFNKVCQAVQHAHQKGIIHRDLKPSNILVTINDGAPVPKVIDFGIAKATEGRLTEMTVYTDLHQFIGTPAYMSPEQATMTSLDIDTRSDIYSLGVLLYELLTGHTPFDTKELMAQGVDALRRMIREKEPMLPSTRLSTMLEGELTTTAKLRASEPPRLIHQVRGDLDWIVMKALEKNRMRRYETANGIAVDIQRHLDNEPIVARPPTAAYRLQKFVRRNKLAVSTIGAVALALLLGVIVSTWQAMRAAQLRKEAQAGEQKALAAQTKEAAERQPAESSEKTAQRLLYAAKMNLARAAWEQNQVGQVRRLLEETATYPDRGFEWYYWQRQTHMELKTLRGHLGAIRAVAFSPDGQRIVTGSKDKTAIVWDATTGTELLTLKGHLAEVSAVAFSPGGRRIVTGSPDSTAIVWDAVSGKQLLPLKGHRSDLWGVAFSPDGGRIATASADRTAKVWDAANGSNILTLIGHSLDVDGVAFSPDGRWIATASDDRTGKVWDATTGVELVTLKGHEDMVDGVAFSPDSRRIVTGSEDHTGKVWDAATGKELFTLRGHAYKVRSVAFSPNGERIVTASEDQTAKVWDALSGKELMTLKGHGDYVWGAAYSPDGQRIVTVSYDQTAKVWDAATDKEPLTLRGHVGEVFTGAFSATGERVITGGPDQTAKVWETLTGKLLFTLKGRNGLVFAAAFSPDDRLIATAGGDAIRVWNAATADELFNVTGHGAPIKSLEFSPDGRRLLSASADQTAKVWDIAGRKCLLTLRGHTDGVMTAAFSTDGRRIVTGSNDSTAKVWDAANGALLLTLRRHSTNWPVTSAHFSPDNRQILTSSGDQTAKLWDSATGTNLLTLRGHSDVISRAAFSPDGRRIVTSSFDQTAKVWDAASGAELLTLKGHAGYVFVAAFAPNGRRVLTCGGDATAKVWRAASAEDVALWQKEETEVSARLALEARDRAAAAEQDLRVRAQDPGVIREWLVTPPWNYTNQTGAAALDEEQLLNEARLRPRPGEWRAVRVADPFLDFSVINRMVDPRRSVAYAVSYIRSEAEHTGLSLKVGSDDEAKIYLNGKEIYRRDQPRGFVQDQDEAAGVELKAGLNVLVLKAVIELAETDAEHWRCSVRLTDAAGHFVKGIRASITPADDEGAGAISQWLVLAPIRFEGTNGVVALDHQQLPDETHLLPNAGQRSRAGGGELVWMPFHLDDYSLDFTELSGVTNANWCVAYAVSYVESDTDQPDLSIKIGSGDQCKVYLNGKEIYRWAEPRSFAPDQDTVSGIELKAGLNVLVFKVVNETRDWLGSIRFTDAAGQPVKGIRVTLSPPPLR